MQRNAIRAEWVPRICVTRERLGNDEACAMNTTFSTLSLALALSALGAAAACSPSVSKEAPDCVATPKAKGCARPAAASDDAGVAAVLTSAPQPLPGADGGGDAGGDGAAAAPHKPTVPPPNVACQDLTRCCAKVADTVERAACVGIAVSQSASTCANAIIAYQVFGGCSHAGSVLPDIFGPDKTPRADKSCEYLERACIQNPASCDAAYVCNGATIGTASSPRDPCASASDPYCCRYPNGFDCGGSPPPAAADVCASAPDPYCCRYPNGFDCGGSPDPCASAPDPECCRYPNSFDCGGTPDPCASAPDPYCCRYPNSFDCGGGP